MEKELNKQINDTKTQIESSKEQLVIDIQKSKPTLKLDFLTTKELVDSDDPLAAKATQDKIKSDLKELNKLITCLWH